MSLLNSFEPGVLKCVNILKSSTCPSNNHLRIWAEIGCGYVLMSLQNHPRENIFPEVSDGQLFQDFQVSQRVEFKVELTMPTSLQENAEEVVMRGDTV